MPFSEATLAVLTSRIELKPTMSNALGETEHIRGAKGCGPRNEGTLQPDTEHIHDAQACRNAIAAVTGTARASAGRISYAEFERRESKALADLDRCDAAQYPTSLILNEDI
jgi:hypothetical protein